MPSRSGTLTSAQGYLVLDTTQTLNVGAGQASNPVT
jgi:hypothetical protein